MHSRIRSWLVFQKWRFGSLLCWFLGHKMQVKEWQALPPSMAATHQRMHLCTRCYYSWIENGYFERHRAPPNE